MLATAYPISIENLVLLLSRDYDQITKLQNSVPFDGNSNAAYFIDLLLYLQEKNIDFLDNGPFAQIINDVSKRKHMTHVLLRRVVIEQYVQALKSLYIDQDELTKFYETLNEVHDPEAGIYMLKWFEEFKRLIVETGEKDVLVRVS